MKNDLDYKPENIELEEDLYNYTKTATLQNLNTDHLMTTHPDSIPTEKTNKDAPIIMTLDIESGKTDKILIFFDSNPDKIAYDFCKKHNLNFESLEFLKQEIQKQIDENVQKIEESKRQITDARENNTLISDRTNNCVINTEEKDDFNTAKTERKIDRDKEKSNNKMFSYEIFMNRNKAEETKDNSLIKKCNSSIFNRLYMMNNKKAKNENHINNNNDLGNIRKKRTNSNNKNDSINFGINTGERMYQRAMKQKEESMRKMQKLKEIEMKTLNDNCTFSPKLISSSSQIGLSNLKKRILTDAYSLNNLNKYFVEREEKINQLKEKYSEMNFCSFSPKINNRSNMIIGEKYPVFNTDSNCEYRNDKNTELFEYSKVRNLKLKTMESEFYSQFTHKPCINNNILISSNFNERQEYMIKKQLEFQGKMKDAQENNIDPETGQKYFIPKVNASGSFSRNLNKNVYHHLYENGKKMRQEREKKSYDLQREILNNSTKVFTSHLTETIFNNTKKNTYRKLYKIAKEYYPFIKNTMKLSPDVYKILNPLFVKIKEGFHKYKEETFVSECDNLFQVRNYINKKLNINQKSILINFVKNYDKKEIMSDTVFTFKPKINNRKSSSKFSYSRITYCFEKQSSKGSADLFS